jgi:hypothetical protein
MFRTLVEQQEVVVVLSEEELPDVVELENELEIDVRDEVVLDDVDEVVPVELLVLVFARLSVVTA